MLPANAPSMPVFQRLSMLVRGLPRRKLCRVFMRLLRPGSRGRAVDVASLSADMLDDVGIEAPIEGRADAFWTARRRSVGRDLPL